MKTLAILGASAAAVSAAGAANATLLVYTLAGIDSNGVVEASTWYMNSNPTVASSTSGVEFEVDNISGNFNYGTDFHADVDNLTFYHLGAYISGTATVFDYEGIVDFNGPQLYSGTEAAPTMLTGVFQVFDYYSNAPLTLTVAAVPSAVPEPESWALMIGGFGMIGAALRARRTSLSYSKG